MIREIIHKLLPEKYFNFWLILLIDTGISIFGTFIAYLIVKSLFHVPFYILQHGLVILILSAICSVIGFFVCKTYRTVIRHSTLREAWKLAAAVFCKIGLMTLFYFGYPGNHTYSTSITIGCILDALITLFLLLGTRIAMIVVYDTIKHQLLRRDNCKRVLIFGASEKQISLKLRLQDSPHYQISGFLTFGRQLKSHTIAGLPVYYFEDINSINYLSIRHGIDAVLFADYNTAQEEKERLIKFCAEVGVKVLIAPPIDEMTDGKLPKQNIREILIEDLLGRAEIKISLDEIRKDLAGKTILVTGAAGSIGSELCRQLAGFGVKQLVLFDNSETPMHSLRLELEERFPELKFIPIIGDVRSLSRLNFTFQTYKPQIVFHAAAYKHVPLMEENPCEAVLVNVCGSRNVADYCLKYNIEKMVMISTDKAVNPTNIMGASKRIAEIYVQTLGQTIATGKVRGVTQFVTTRFGNVLGSNGSVIPRFRAQIEKGGPVTVTHPYITRFFMTIPEACRLVMEAATLSSGNDIFVFDMGDPIKISDLAKRMIELAGLQPDKDIKIAYTGLRPGEKLYEEVLADTENTKPTPHPKIRVAEIREYDYHNARQTIDQMEIAADRIQIEETVLLMKQLVPEFLSKNSDFERLDKAPQKNAG